MVILDTSGTGFHGVIVYVVFDITEGPHLTRILGLEKTALHEIRISGTVCRVSPTNTKIRVDMVGTNHDKVLTQ